MDPTREPDMSVVIVTPDRFDTIRRTIGYLRGQNVSDRLEIVIVAPSADSLDLDPAAMEGFAGYVIVEVGAIESIGGANAAGVRRARAALVVFAEDHAYPEPGWAEALIEAHRMPWPAVGPVVRPANPGNSLSRVDFFLGFGPWSGPARGGDVDHLPGNNSCYKRDVLIGYGPDLERMLAAETVLHWDLRRQGHRLRLEPGARLAHVNFARLGSWILVQFHHSRRFASVRASNWRPTHRLLFAVASPLIPLVRLARVLRGPPSFGSTGLRTVDLPTLLFGLVISATGEMLGYATGSGNSRQKLTFYEFHRERHVTERDRRELAARADKAFALSPDPAGVARHPE